MKKRILTMLTLTVTALMLTGLNCTAGEPFGNSGKIMRNCSKINYPNNHSLFLASEAQTEPDGLARCSLTVINLTPSAVTFMGSTNNKERGQYIVEPLQSATSFIFNSPYHNTKIWDRVYPANAPQINLKYIFNGDHYVVNSFVELSIENNEYSDFSPRFILNARDILGNRLRSNPVHYDDFSKDNFQYVHYTIRDHNTGHYLAVYLIVDRSHLDETSGVKDSFHDIVATLVIVDKKLHPDYLKILDLTHNNPDNTTAFREM